ncbi:MAG: superoxide dismutase [Phycisphaerales bacterium]|nr:superoxide dismutase [Phycisphaerales bacterium]
MPWQLAPLPFAPDALEPHFDRQTQEIHHGKHHQGYVNNLNAAIAKHPELDGKKLHDLLAHECAGIPEDIRTAVRNNGGGVHNHNLWWEILNPKDRAAAPVGKLAAAINATFGSFDKFKEAFKTAGSTRFGSGWAWLVKKGDKLEVMSTANQDSPILFGAFPVIGADVWEHAYYLKYQNRRPDYLDAFWNVVNWRVAEERFGRAK